MLEANTIDWPLVAVLLASVIRCFSRDILLSFKSRNFSSANSGQLGRRLVESLLESSNLLSIF